MLTQMQDSAHDCNHIYRVLHFALDIAAHEAHEAGEIDIDVLIAACLLHDIGREKQFANPGVCHAQVGAEMAYALLPAHGWTEQKTAHVRDCIATHRYRRGNPAVSIEAKILFDADKLDCCGALGIARSLLYEGQVSEPLYLLDEDGAIVTGGGGADISSFFQEYAYKLGKIGDSLHTGWARTLAAQRSGRATAFRDGLYSEIMDNYTAGRERLASLTGAQ